MILSYLGLHAEENPAYSPAYAVPTFHNAEENPAYSPAYAVPTFHNAEENPAYSPAYAVPTFHTASSQDPKVILSEEDLLNNAQTD